MKNTFKKMVAMMSTMIIAFGCLINKMDTPDAEAAEDSVSTTINVEEIENEMVAKFNEARAELGLEPLYIIPSLNDAAEVRASEIVTSYSHTRTDSSSFLTVIANTAVKFFGAGEILLRGSANVDAIFSAWKSSPGHWAIITKPEATHIGISAHFDPDSDKRWYWAAEIVTIPEGSEPEEQRLPENTAQNEESAEPAVKNEEPAETIISGDLNFDGVVDCFDVIFMTRYINGTMEFNEAQLEAADMIKDGIVTDLDASILKMFILGKINSFSIF